MKRSNLPVRSFSENCHNKVYHLFFPGLWIVSVLDAFPVSHSQLDWYGSCGQCRRCNLLRNARRQAPTLWQSATLGCCRLGYILLPRRISGRSVFTQSPGQGLFRGILYGCHSNRVRHSPVIKVAPHTNASIKNVFKDLRKLFSSLRAVVFFAWCVAVGLGTSLIWNFLFWHLEELGSSQEGCDQLQWID